MLVIEDITTEKSLRRTMARYLPKEVTDKVLADDTDSLGGKMQKASVLFSDIRAFTQISAEIGPQETVSMLNDYFSTMVEVISEHGGMLDKYIGDALMAVFGVPYLQHDDANRALVSGLRMLDGLERFNRTWVPKGNKPIKIGIGLNTDLVLSGNIGSPKRMDFTVIGDGVNVAAKLEAANKFYGTKMLITEFTKAALTEDVPLREVDRVLVKGRSDALTIFEPLDSIPTSERETLNTLLGPYTEGLEFYRNRNWGLAFQAFEAARQIKKDDRLTQVYLDRCAQHIHKPPSDDWNGVYSLMEK
tara:strand:- start:156 stop:1064 length:909 start_codon:yes stop_codon:yes gene_type:complete